MSGWGRIAFLIGVGVVRFFYHAIFVGRFLSLSYDYLLFHLWVFHIAGGRHDFHRYLLSIGQAI